MKNFLFITFMMTGIIFLSSCNKSQIRKDTPFMIVVKLLSAEQNLHFDEAKKYIDVNQVYSKYPNSEDPEKEWTDLLLFNHNLAKDPKFTNSIDFTKFEIEETIDGKKSKVSLKNKDTNNSIKEIIYELEDRGDHWVVTTINYIKN